LDGWQKRGADHDLKRAPSDELLGIEHDGATTMSDQDQGAAAEQPAQILAGEESASARAQVERPPAQA
jgi:hypothetical protein